MMENMPIVTVILQPYHKVIRFIRENAEEQREFLLTIIPKSFDNGQRLSSHTFSDWRTKAIPDLIDSNAVQQQMKQK